MLNEDGSVARLAPGGEVRASAVRSAVRRLGPVGGLTWPATELDPDTGLPEPVTEPMRALRCLEGRGKVAPCERVAGEGTAHPGVGACRAHERRGQTREGAWMVAHVIARELAVSPWEALLVAVRRAAGAAAFYQEKLASAPNDDSLAVGGSHRGWLEDWERAHDRSVRYAKLAIDAGVAAAMVAQARGEGEQLARILNRALAEVELGEETEQLLRQALRRSLLEQDGGPMLPAGLDVA